MPDIKDYMFDGEPLTDEMIELYKKDVNEYIEQQIVLTKIEIGQE